MLNQNITEQTPMAEILANVNPKMIEDLNNSDVYKAAQGLIKELYDM